jgi:aryl-alcohol dehydrogenase-like predicted oxidoreductase
METRRIGSLDVSVVGLGCNNFGGRLDAEGTNAVVRAAIDAGITLFDTADIYGGTKSEAFLGAALGADRDRVVVASKFGMPVDDTHKGASAAYVKEAVDASLRRLGTDRIDLYQLHIPDNTVPIDETLGALDELVRAGKVREIGCSNFSSDQLEEADRTSRERGRARFVSVQNEYSLLQREPEASVLGTCEKLDLAFIPYFPLASGVLTGKYRRGEEPPAGTRLASYPADRRARSLSDRNLDLVENLETWARDHGHTVLELAMSWLAVKPVVASVIAGATRPEQIHANVAAVEWAITPDELREIDGLLAER